MSDSSLASFLGEVVRSWVGVYAWLRHGHPGLCLLLPEAISPFRRWCRSSLLAMLGTDLVLFLALRARLASLSVAVLTYCLLVGMVASLVEVFSGMLLGRLRRPGVPSRWLAP